MRRVTTAQLRQAAFIVALGVGVTVGGVAAGALVLAPAVAGATKPGVGASVTRTIDAGFGTLRSATATPSRVMTARWMTLPASVRRLALPMLFGSLAVTGFAATGISLLRRRPTLRMPAAGDTVGSTVADTLASVSVLWGGAGRSTGRGSARSGGRVTGRSTPRAVQALADAGTELSEIARRTGLSLDAVAMLLSIGSGSRQLRPPTA